MLSKHLLACFHQCVVMIYVHTVFGYAVGDQGGRSATDTRDALQKGIALVYDLRVSLVSKIFQQR